MNGNTKVAKDVHQPVHQVEEARGAEEEVGLSVVAMQADLFAQR